MFRVNRRIKWAVGISAAVGALMLLLTGMYIVIQRNQNVTLPAPTGPYAVGRVLDEWTDTTRAETLAATPGQYRELTVWIWYPADPPNDAALARYLPPTWAHARDQTRGLGTFLFQSASSIHTHAYANVPVSRQRATYPVLIFEPGLGPVVSDYTTLLEDVASHGYIIIGVNPTYSASAVVFSDGRVVRQSTQGNLPENASVAETKRLGDQLVHTWAEDIVFAMDQAQQLNADPGGLFAGHLDLARIGIFGHSLGGAAAAEACHLDDRCAAGADLDGYPYGDVVQTGLRQPFMFVWSAGNDPNDAHYRQAVQDISAIYDRLETGYQVTIRGVRHFNFMDYAVEFSPVLRVLGMLGSIDGRQGLAISRAYVVTFFDTYLNDGDPARLYDLSTGFPDVTFEAGSATGPRP